MEAILMSGSTEILKKLVGAVSEDIGSALGVKDDLKKLQSTSEMILAVIADAEKRQEKDELVRLWLRRLKDIAYDIDDVMDEFSYEDLRREDKLKHKVINSPSPSNPSLAFRIKMGKKIKKINKSLDEITKDMGRFQLEITTPIPDGESTEQLDRQDTSHINESEIVGREDDESQIIKLLTTHTTSSSSSTPFPNPNQYPENVSVISIVGVGGLGKTALAQLVYKDKLVKEVFEVTGWTHVSEYFDINIILENILESITLTEFFKPSNFHVLVDRVQNRLNGKKYLLVLDDLWNEDWEKWDTLMSVLLVGAPGSKILITTRNHQVASVVRGSIPPYSLSRLQDDACWSIIKKKAFSSGGALNAPKMSGIGKEIAEKCCGLPLAAKFLGSLLYSKNKESDWVSIRDDDDIWNIPESQERILSILKLSYNNLPSHLKQCVSYCSIFPKNWEISKETLVHLWMAEGFLKQSNVRNKRSIEDCGRDYFESLAWSSFFQDFKMNELGDIETCKMHDLVHDLAKAVLEDNNEVVSLKATELKNVSEVRRLWLQLDKDISAASLSNAEKLRTLFIPEGSNLNPSIFSENNHLRILHVGHSPKLAFPKLPSFNLKLRHLRYLRLTSLNVREVENDQSIGELYSLETLILNNMYGVQNLLSNIQSLVKLRYLEVSSCRDMVELPDSVTKLYNLQTLDLTSCRLKFIPDSIAGLENLRFLNLSFNPIDELPLSVLTLSNLETLDVSQCYYLKALPEYVSSLVNLRIFNFRDCRLLEALPEDFGALTQLRSLDIGGTHIKLLPESWTNLGNLEYVDLSYCEVSKEVTNWTKLRKFYHGSKETPLGIGKSVFLQRLSYKVREKVFNNDGIEELGHLNSLESLIIWDLRNVEDPVDAERANLKEKQKLQKLYLNWGGSGMWSWWDNNKSSNLQVTEALRPPAGLRELRMSKFVGSEFPTWMSISSDLPNLVKLELDNFIGIEQLPAAIGQLPRLQILHLTRMSLKSLDIGGFPSLMILHLDYILLEELSCSNPSYLQNLSVIGCQRLTEIPSIPSLVKLVLQEKIDQKVVCSVGRSLTSLTDLRLSNIKELVYFPISILQTNCNLQSLYIMECRQFEGFLVNEDKNENESSSEFHVVSLRRLEITYCPVLMFLPDLRRWTSLRKLRIVDCPQLKKYLTYDLRSLTFIKELYVDFKSDIQSEVEDTFKEQRVDFTQKYQQGGDPPSSLFKGKLPLSTEGKTALAIWIKKLLYQAPELDPSLGEWREKLMFDVEMEQEQSRSKNKSDDDTQWRPTLEQERILDLLEKCGLLSPTLQQIEEITKQLSNYGKVQNRDVYGWFLAYI